jgi:NAD-dependent SIR2 family protein deacetylase
MYTYVYIDVYGYVYIIICMYISGVLKPDITFFGEILPDCFFKAIKQDVERCDLVIVIGTCIYIYVCDRFAVHVFVVFIHELKKAYGCIYNNDVFCVFFQSDKTRRREMRFGYRYRYV